MEQLRLSLKTGNFDNFTQILKDLKLEAFTNDDTFEKIIFKLDSKGLYDKIYELMLKLSKYHSNSFQSELKEGIKILLTNKYEVEVLELLKYCVETSKNVDEYLFISVMKACFNKKNHYEKCFEIIKLINSSSNTLSHFFWQEAIEGFTKSFQPTYACELIKLYPIKFSYSESLWRSFIKSQMNDSSVSSCFNLLKDKYEQRTIHDEFKSFENIFNIFLEELIPI